MLLGHFTELWSTESPHDAIAKNLVSQAQRQKDLTCCGTKRLNAIWAQTTHKRIVDLSDSDKAWINKR